MLMISLTHCPHVLPNCTAYWTAPTGQHQLVMSLNTLVLTILLQLQHCTVAVEAHVLVVMINVDHIRDINLFNRLSITPQSLHQRGDMTDQVTRELGVIDIMIQP